MSAACAVLAALLIAFPLTSPAAGVSSADEALLAAHAAYLAGDKAKLARRAANIRNNVLAPYLDFWRLRLNLEDAAPGEIKDFLARHAGTTLAEQLRREWLLVLGKKGPWEVFREERPSLVKDDPEVACYALLAQQGVPGAPPAAEGIKPFWRTPKALPEGCAPLAEALMQAGEIKPRDLRERFRLLVQAGLLAEAKRVAARLPKDQAPPAEQIDEAARSPVRFLERSNDGLKTAAGRELAIVALTRLAQNDPQPAAERWNGRLREGFPPEDRQYVWIMLAVAGARRHLPEAVEWFREAGDAPLSDEQLVWRARIALRQENWPEVKRAIERLSPPARSEPAWSYWLGRAMLALGERESGRALLDRIAGGHHFYGRLAAEELGMPLRIPPVESPPAPNEVAEVEAMAGLRRALALYRLGMREEATLEWIWTVRALDDRALLAAAELARRNGIWDRAINTADRTVAAHDFTLRYLTPYREVLSKESRVRQLEEPWVFGLVRQESRFIPDVVSSAGAVGLMQLLPSTARWAAKKIGMRGFHPSRISRPEVNAVLGAFYLRHVLDEFEGSQILAAAAYNAGPGRAHRWRDVRPLEGAIYIETIPFAETRQYVKNVMANTVYYAALLGGEQPSLKARLGMIAGATSPK